MSLNLNDPTLVVSRAFINGNWVAADNGEQMPVINPATGATIAQVAKCAAQEATRAIAAAHRALQGWKATTAKARSNLLRTWFNLMMENQEDLARILTAEQGKPLAEARAEIAYGASYIEWFAEEAKRIYGDIIPQPSNDKRLLVIKQPIGVVAAITPWNFPNAMLTRKLAPALAAGCTAVCKPANATPLSALAIGILAERAGIPAGVINILTGNTVEIGRVITSNKLVRKLTFTGSTKVGKQLMRECADTVKRTSMELGGNAPFIVFDDADLDTAVAAAVASKFRNAGQTCVCSNRLLIQSGIYQAFTAKLISAVNALKIGNGIDEGVNIGPLINSAAANNVLALIDDAIANGAKVICGGNRSKLGPNFIEPTILTEVHNAMKICTEEIFGPVAPLIRFETEDDALTLANDTDAGLASYICTRDIGRVWRIAEGLEYGIVGINDGIISNEMAPFGGIKESGNGREGSKYGIEDYLEIKYLCLGGIDSSIGN